MSDQRTRDLIRFYDLLNQLEHSIGGARQLTDCSGRMNWPLRGVYFFREPGENRSETGSGPRIVRVGTHALNAGSGSKLWGRLSQHRGSAASGGGNHRGSIFRLIAGTGLMTRDDIVCATWGQGSSAPRDVRDGEQHLEKRVSLEIGVMPFLWLDIGDEPGPDSLRGLVERNSIALLSNSKKDPLDPPSERWLGNYCDRERVRRSGLWNSNHVDEQYNPAFLDVLESLVADVKAQQ